MIEPSPSLSDAPHPATDADGPTDTKDRLLEAGIEIFAERGFADASIRQICARANANAAAVNYHFGGKAPFYAEVLATCHIRAAERRPMPRLDDDPDHPEAVLRAWIRWFLELLMVDGDGPLGRLMAREMAEPTSALDELVLRSMLPIMRRLGTIVRALLPDAPEATLRLCHNSLVGQVLFYKHAQPVIGSIGRLARRGEIEDTTWTPAAPALPGDPAPSSSPGRARGAGSSLESGADSSLESGADSGPAPGADVDLDRLADHIFRFSLAGFHALADAPAAGAAMEKEAVK